ncbi:PLP-dependent aminotransferase family protein [Komagataeibacter xylinus]|uniref:PLP-dependent aminotransferase family protein n=1 Tax=Komagataeibacter xylinus TaxID=28448 RepID=A0A857FQS5_KOMXY|nr:PLP-dependent aminotransferase family protein [Komagataeibacter xylinus]QHC35849.1 PLP-dependent aminotransferase family protein [Komagataeibacter xylinus]
MGRQARRAVLLGIVLETDGGQTLQAQIREQIRRAILEGRLACGTKLPSSRLLAAELGCARGTVLAALDQLQAEGYLVARSSSGVSVAQDLPDDMLAPAPTQSAPHAPMPPPLLPERTRVLLRHAQHAPGHATPGEPPIAFPLGQPDRQAFPFALWAKLLEQDWRRPAWPIAGTPPPFGHPALQQAIAAHLRTARGFSCAPESIVITAGVRQSVSLFARIALEAGEPAWVEEPGYPGIRAALAASGIRAVPVAIDESGFAPATALAMAPDARLAIVAPSHHYPLGTVLGLQRRLALLSWAQRRQGWIIEDDFDGEYRYSGRPLAPLRALDRAGRVAYLGSFSKLLFPALRLSYIVLPPALVPAAQVVLPQVFTPAPLMGQGALARFIAEGHLVSHLRRTRLLYAARQNSLMEVAARSLTGLMHITPDSGGMHVVACPAPALAPGFDDHAATAAALKAGVRVAPLSECYAGPRKQHGLLLGYAGTPHHEIDPAMRRLAHALEAFMPHDAGAGCPAGRT